MKDRPAVYLLIDDDSGLVQGVYWEKADAEAEIDDRNSYYKQMNREPISYSIERWQTQ